MMWLGQNPSIPEPEMEFKFHPQEAVALRLCMARLGYVAVEIEGGLYKGGRHQSLRGFLADAEKYEAALNLGWTVYRVPGPWVMEGDRYIWRGQVMDTLRWLLRCD